MPRIGPGLTVLALAVLTTTASAQKKTAPRGTPPPPAVTASRPVAVAVAGNAELGRGKADAERCVECHGVDGQGAGHSNGPEGKFAKLAGQHPAYLLKQLTQFRSGERKHDIMQMMARSVEWADLVDIAAYFASLSPMQGDGTGDNAVGRKLYQAGDPARSLVACASCHGQQGVGAAGDGAGLVPRVAGQEWRYLERQLLDWRNGWRKNSPGGVMTEATRSLTDGEISDLASYLSGLR